MKWIAPVLCLASTVQTAGPTHTTYTDHPHGDTLLLPTEESKLPTKLPDVVIESWNYDPVQKTLTLHLVNHSHKIVTAFNISMAEKYADGSTNPWYADGIPTKLQDSQKMEDELSLLIQSKEQGQRWDGIAVTAPIFNILVAPGAVFAAGAT